MTGSGSRFDSLHVFVAVCDAGSFVAAARRLGRSAPAVTRSVAALEARLGARLLHRTTRSLSPTDAGARFLERARAIVAELEDAELAVRDARAEPRGRLSVAAPVLFGRLHVAPVVAALLARHAGLSVDLELSDRYANLVEEGIDVAVRIGDLADSALVARRLGSTGRVLVASPGYLAQAGVPERPEHLARHALIASRPAGGTREWRLREPATGAALAVPIAPRLSGNSVDAAILYALAGGGITAALRYQVQDALAGGRLTEVLAAWAPPPLPIQAVFASSRLLSATVRAFLEEAARAAAAWRFDP